MGDRNMFTNNSFNKKTYKLIILFITLMSHYMLAMLTVGDLPKKTYLPIRKKKSPSLKKTLEVARTSVPLDVQKLAEEREADLVRNKAIGLNENQFYLLNKKTYLGSV